MRGNSIGESSELEVSGSATSGVPSQLIRVMPDTLANKIAAGEVVQRPASAVKEMIENALDAGADQVTVVLKAAGRELIQVIDDGCGMGTEDAVTCFLRHATSKIRSVDDLERILTLGFRGEALASIAAVAQVELRTKRHNDPVGICVRVDGGVMQATEPCATPDGTSLAVRNLFYNVPARRNFLKSPATEFKHLVETFQFLALSNPRVGFTLIHDDHEVYRLTASRAEDPFEATRHRIVELFGPPYDSHLVPVEEATSYLSVYGFVGRSDFYRKSRGEQFLFVNGRFVKHRSLEHAVASSYGDMLPEGAHPFFTLFLDLDPRHVDVNVHPTKAEVKFDDERGVYGFLRAVVKKALGTVDLTPRMTASMGADAVVAGAAARPRPFVPAWDAGVESMGRPGARPPRSGGQGYRDDGSLPAGEQSARLYEAVVPETTTDADAMTGEVVPSGALPGPALDDEREPLLWQLNDAYIITQIRSGLMIVDQNAAHERILYEKAMQSLNDGFGLSQQLLFPHTHDLNPADYELLKELLPELKSLGFVIDLFSGRSLVIRGVPTDIRPGDEKSVLEEVLEQYKSYRDTLQLKRRELLARSIARRGAIRQNTRLSRKEMRALIDQLFSCEMPYAGPHGKPTMIQITMDELSKRFGRGGASSGL